MRILRLKKFSAVLLGLAALLVCSTGANATLIAPGGTGVPALDSTAATEIAFMSVPFTGAGGALTGSLSSAVFKEGGGTLDFYYQVVNSGASSDSVVRMTMLSFVSWTTDVFYRTDTPAGFAAPSAGTAPTSADRAFPSGDSVGFDFQAAHSCLGGDCVLPGENSDILVIKTNATVYGGGFLSAIDGGTSTVTSFAPGPEPASIVLLGTTLIGLTFLVRRRRLSHNS